MKKKALLLLFLVLFISSSFGVEAALKDSLGNIFDSISNWFQNGGWQNHTKIIDFFIWFIVFLSAAMMSFTKLAGDKGSRNVYIGLSTGVALALSFALITQEKFSLSSFLFPFAKYFLVFLTIIAFFFIWKSIMPNHSVWAFVLALVTAFVLFGAVNAYVNEDGFFEWVGVESSSSSESSDRTSDSGTSKPSVDTSKLNCDRYDSQIDEYKEVISGFSLEQAVGANELDADKLVNVIFEQTKGVKSDNSNNYKICILKKIGVFRELINDKKIAEESKIIYEIDNYIADITDLAKVDLEGNVEEAKQLLVKIKSLRNRLQADE